jgi:hypothetical protein
MTTTDTIAADTIYREAREAAGAAYGDLAAKRRLFNDNDSDLVIADERARLAALVDEAKARYDAAKGAMVEARRASEAAAADHNP